MFIEMYFQAYDIIFCRSSFSPNFRWILILADYSNNLLTYCFVLESETPRLDFFSNLNPWTAYLYKYFNAQSFLRGFSERRQENLQECGGDIKYFKIWVKKFIKFNVCLKQIVICKL